MKPSSQAHRIVKPDRPTLVSGGVLLCSISSTRLFLPSRIRMERTSWIEGFLKSKQLITVFTRFVAKVVFLNY